MSSLITVNNSEEESILPGVEELSQFHPDQLSSLVDIQEELEKLEENDDVDAVMALSAVDDDNVVVDHEVTIVADQPNDETSILPDISETTCQSSNSMEKLSGGQSFNTMELKKLDTKEADSVTVGSASNKEDSLVYSAVSLQSSNSDNLVAKKVSNIATALPLSISPQVSAMKQLSGALKEKSTLSSTSHKQNVLTKVIFTQNNQAAPDAPFLFGESGGQTIKLIGQNKTIITNSSSTKAITFAQAKEMGLISPGKMHILPNKTKCIAKKNLVMSSNKTLTVVKSSPTKILPLPTSGHLHPIVSSSAINTLTPHKILIRQSPAFVKSGSFSNTIVSTGSVGTTGHILQLPMGPQENNQIHQIHLPGKQVQYVRLINSVSTTTTSVTESVAVTSSNSPSVRPLPVALTANLSHIKMLPIAPVSGSITQNTNSFERMLLSPGMSQLTSNSDSKTSTTNIVMVPAEYVKKYKPQLVNQSPPSPLKPVSSTNMAASSPPTPSSPPQLPPVSTCFTKDKEVFAQKETVSTPVTIVQKSKSTDLHNGIRPRKACNCTKSQCLKLFSFCKENHAFQFQLPMSPFLVLHFNLYRYCDCFANGEFCFQCNCNCCFNNLDHEEDRQRAIKSCLERNPNAFRPKIGKGYVGDERRHNKGCNCKRSGCLKNYCECYEAKIPCSNNCKCVGCRNVEEMRIRDKCSIEGKKINQQPSLKPKLSCEILESTYKPNLFLTNQNARHPSNLMTQEVVEATCQCLLAQVENNFKLSEQVERLILEEFGRCLVEIIDCATRTTVPNTV